MDGDGDDDDAGAGGSERTHFGVRVKYGLGLQNWTEKTNNEKDIMAPVGSTIRAVGAFFRGTERSYLHQHDDNYQLFMIIIYGARSVDWMILRISGGKRRLPNNC